MSRRSDYLGFGKVNSGAEQPSTITVFFPFIASSEEKCERCGVISARELMQYAGCDQDDEALYICGPTVGCRGETQTINCRSTL